VATTLLDHQREAHARVARQGIATTAATLQTIFGQRLTAAIAGVKDPKAVGRWARGTDVPRAPAAAALENVLQVVELLRTGRPRWLFDPHLTTWFRPPARFWPSEFRAPALGANAPHPPASVGSSARLTR